MPHAYESKIYPTKGFTCIPPNTNKVKRQGILIIPTSLVNIASNKMLCKGCSKTTKGKYKPCSCSHSHDGYQEGTHTSSLAFNFFESSAFPD